MTWADITRRNCREDYHHTHSNECNGSLVQASTQFDSTTSSSSTSTALVSRQASSIISNEICQSGINHSLFASNTMMALHKKNGDKESALCLLNKIQKDGLEHDVTTYNMLIELLADNGDPGKALSLLREMLQGPVETRPNRTTFKILIRCFATNEKFTISTFLHEDMCDAGIFPDNEIYDIFLQGYLKYGAEDEKIWTLLQDMPDTPHGKTYELLIPFFQKNGCIVHDNLTKPILIEEIECGPLGMGINPDTDNYNALMDYFAEKGHKRGIKSLLKEMRVREIKPDMETCRIRIRMCVYKNMGYLKNARALMSEMEKEGIEPSKDIYAALMELCRKKGNQEEIKALSEEMERKGIELDVSDECEDQKDRTSLNESKNLVRSYNNQINSLIQRHQDFGPLLEKMKQSGIKPNLNTYNILMKDYVSRSDLEGGRAMMCEMKQKGILPDACTYATLMNYFVNTNNVEGGWTLYLEMKDSGFKPNRFIFSILLKLNQNDLHGGRALYNTMLEDGLEPDVHTYTDLINLHFKNNDFQSAIALFNKMKRSRIEPNVVTYSLLMHLYRLKGDPDKGIALFTEMKQKKIEPNVVSYTELKKLYMEKKDEKALKGFLKELQQDGILSKDLTFGTFINTNFSDGSKKNWNPKLTKKL